MLFIILCLWATSCKRINIFWSLLSKLFRIDASLFLDRPALCFRLNIGSIAFFTITSEISAAANLGFLVLCGTNYVLSLCWNTSSGGSFVCCFCRWEFVWEFLLILVSLLNDNGRLFTDGASFGDFSFDWNLRTTISFISDLLASGGSFLPIWTILACGSHCIQCCWWLRYLLWQHVQHVWPFTSSFMWLLNSSARVLGV